MTAWDSRDKPFSLPARHADRGYRDGITKVCLTIPGAWGEVKDVDSRCWVLPVGAHSGHMSADTESPASFRTTSEADRVWRQGP
jgi:hypothetical protein